MAKPLQRRGKRVVADSSDVETEHPKPPATSAALPDRGRSTRPNVKSASATPNSSPQVTPKKHGSKKEDIKSLHSFFNTTDKDTWRKAQAQIRESKPKVEPDTAIEDISDDERFSAFSKIAVNARKRPWTPETTKPKPAAAGYKNKFLKTNDGRSLSVSQAPNQSTAAIDSDTRPWPERYAPASLDELAVHKKKVADVQQWLEMYLDGRHRQQMLILKGSAGAGKSATVELLAKSLGLELLEWRNPVVEFAGANYTSVASQFDDFINRGRASGSLDLDDEGEGNAFQKDTTSAQKDRRKQLLFIEEFPNIFYQQGAGAVPFRTTILQYLAASAGLPRSASRPNPVIMVISEATLSNSGNASENFTAHRLLGREILSNPFVSLIEFNAVAPTFVLKALNLVIQKHKRTAGITNLPEQDMMRKIAEIGDIRHALSTMQFLSLEGNTGTNPSAPSGRKKCRQGGKANESDALALLSLRESALGLFHAIGKVLYNKRSLPIPNPSLLVEKGDTEGSIPLHMASFARIQTSDVNVDALPAITSTDTSTFLAAIHENFIPSAALSSYSSEEKLVCITNILDNLSQADLLGSCRFETTYGNNYSGSEGITQSDLSFAAGVRGTLFHLPHPVKRAQLSGIPGRSGKGDAHRMFYPVGLKLWRIQEENNAIVDNFADLEISGKLRQAIEARQDKYSRRAPPLVREISQPGRMPTTEEPVDGGMHHGEQREDGPSALPGHIGGQSARQQMLVERLPYLAKVLASGPLARQLEKVTAFRGLAGIADDDDDDSSEGHDLLFAKASEKVPDGPRFGLGEGDKAGEGDLGVEHLVLSEDDIEDA